MMMQREDDEEREQVSFRLIEDLQSGGINVSDMCEL